MAAPIQVRGQVTRLWWFEVPWVCGGMAGTRHVRAPDPQSAEHDLELHPSDYGLPHETVLVGRAVPVGRFRM